MRAFSALYEALDATSSTRVKIEAMAAYLEAAEPGDAAWAVYFLSGRRPKRLVGAARLRALLAETVPYPDWLVAASYADVGDLAETVALLLEELVPGGTEERPMPSLRELVEEHLLTLAGLDEAEQAARIRGWWLRLPFRERFIFSKLLTGALRVGVSQSLLARALSAVSGVPREVLLHRLMGSWSPTADFYRALVDPDTRLDDASRPYPFFLASPLELDPADLGTPSQWLAEWKWDGIRGQLVRRDGQVFLWSRGEELVTERFPEIAEAAAALPDGTVLDGEILAWRDGVLGFQALQRRLGRKSVSARLRSEVPVVFLAYDCLEQGGEDLRGAPQAERRVALDELAGAAGIRTSPLLDFGSWSALAALRDQSRDRLVEGVMLKRRDAPYGVGRQRGAWWKWKIEPLSIDAVLIYAQAGHGRRATLFTDYTFAVPDASGELMPIAKAYAGLTDAEITALDRWIRGNTIERFGPVRAVRPEQVFEISFEGISASRRHKSGIAVRFPRIRRWRTDLAPADADTLDQVRQLLR